MSPWTLIGWCLAAVMALLVCGLFLWLILLTAQALKEWLKPKIMRRFRLYRCNWWEWRNDSDLTPAWKHKIESRRNQRLRYRCQMKARWRTSKGHYCELHRQERDAQRSNVHFITPLYG